MTLILYTDRYSNILPNYMPLVILAQAGYAMTNEIKLVDQIQNVLRRIKGAWSRQLTILHTFAG